MNGFDRDPSGASNAPNASDAEFDALLKTLLEGAASSIEMDEPAGPGPDAARVAAHLAGVGDEALLEEASRRSEIRRLLVEVAEDSSALAAAGAQSSAISPAVSAAALSAFDATPRDLARADRARSSAGIEPVGAAPAAVSKRPRLRFLAGLPVPLRVAAAVALVAVPLGFAMYGRSVEAGPLLSLRGIDRLDGEGSVAAEGPVAYPIGHRISAKASEKMALRLSDGSRIVLAGGDEASVVCDGDGDGKKCASAVLQLNRGEAVLSSANADGSGSGSNPVVLLLPDGSRFELDAGVAHIVITPSGEPAASLRAGARALWTPSGGKPADAVLVKGPGSHLLDHFGLRLTGPAADSLFRDLAFFGGDLVGTPPERLTGAGYWRVLDPLIAAPGGNAAEAHASDAAGVPALRLDLPKNGEASISWSPDAEALLADRLTVVFRARPSSVGPRAIPIPEIPTPWLTVSVLSRNGKEVLGSASVGVEAGAERPFHLEIPLPSDFRDVARGGVVLSFRSESAGTSAWFEGAAFRPRRATGASAPPGK